MTTDPNDPNDPNRAFEYPPLDNSAPPPVDPNAPVDYPANYPPVPPYPSPTYPPGGYPPPPPGYPPPFPSPYQGYGGDPYDPYRQTRPSGTNGQAIGALVASLVGLLFCMCAIPSIVGVVLGILAMNETKRTGQEGHGLALAAVIIGGIGLALAVVIWIASALSPSSSSY